MRIGDRAFAVAEAAIARDSVRIRLVEAARGAEWHGAFSQHYISEVSGRAGRPKTVAGFCEMLSYGFSVRPFKRAPNVKSGAALTRGRRTTASRARPSRWTSSHPPMWRLCARAEAEAQQTDSTSS